MEMTEVFADNITANQKIASYGNYIIILYYSKVAVWLIDGNH
jgi:hypothetical protein